MKLAEFFLHESRSTHYTLEPESNGMGRLLAWEKVSYAPSGTLDEEPEDDTSYSVLAHGNIDKLVTTLTKQMPEAREFEDEIRYSFEQCIDDGGEAVRVDENGVEITPKASGQRAIDEDGDPSEDSYF